MRVLSKNNVAEGSYFIVFIALIFFLLMLSVLSFYVMGVSYGFDGADAQTLEYICSAEYDNASASTRMSWLHDHHGGEPMVRHDFGFHWPIMQTYYVFPDGFEMRDDDYVDFCKGDMELGDAIDIWAILGNAFTLNIDLLNELGFLGVVIKIFIGIAFAMIIYLLLPFTG